MVSTQIFLVTNLRACKPPDEKPHRRKCVVPYEGAKHVLADGCCPLCLVDEAGFGRRVFKIAGGNPSASADDRAWEATAVCLGCRKIVGTLRVETDTLFGVQEDERVLNGPWRVY